MPGSPQSLHGHESLLGEFARAVIAQAMIEVGREAARAGRLEGFTALSRFLDADPERTQLAGLTRSLNLGEGAIAIALVRLRRRVQHRIEAALALWSAPGEPRTELRRKLRESLSGTESTP